MEVETAGAESESVAAAAETGNGTRKMYSKIWLWLGNITYFFAWTFYATLFRLFELDFLLWDCRDGCCDLKEMKTAS